MKAIAHLVRPAQASILLLASLGSAPASAQDAPSEGSSELAAEQAPAEDAAVKLDELALSETDRFGAQRRPKPTEPRLPDADASAFDVEANVTLTSDFRRGGVSWSNGKPALQASVSAEHRSGFYGSVWASSIEDNGGANIETDIAVGYNTEALGLTVDVGVIAYIYPGVSNSAYFELQTGLSRKFGEAELGVSVAYIPKQRNAGGDNIYVGSYGSLPVKGTDLTLNGAIGIEDGAFGDRKVDWSLGGVYTLKGFDLGVSYVDSARATGIAHTDPTVVVSLGKTF